MFASDFHSPFSKQSHWYLGLRYTDLMIRAKAPEILQQLLEHSKFPFRQDEDFLCGLCAQLERVTDDDINNQIDQVLINFLVKQSSIFKSRRVHEWVQLVVPAAKRPELPEPRKIHRLISKYRSPKPKNITTLRYQKNTFQTPGTELLGKAWHNCHEAHVFYADHVIVTSPPYDR
ncbi:hypothetical protein F4810DRAFT_679226 [Camillea tinctor]|nr:hypothetical protein F4810DRAFT_679226 [Camillea tinctor]